MSSQQGVDVLLGVSDVCHEGSVVCICKQSESFSATGDPVMVLV